MMLFPRAPKRFVGITDSKVGKVEIGEQGTQIPYRDGVYLATKYVDKVTFKFEGDEVGGPPPTSGIHSPDDVVIPESMLKKAPVAPRIS